MKSNKRKPFDFTVSERGCFECVSHAFDLDGYPLVKRERRMQRVSRYIYEQCFGEIGTGLLVRHKCDNRKCINPEHLELGTHKQNSMDMLLRNRQAKGSRNGASKLTEENVAEIRELKADGVPYSQISKLFGVSIMAIYQIVYRKKWKHVV